MVAEERLHRLFSLYTVIYLLVKHVIWLVENNSPGGKFHLAYLASGCCGCMCARLCSYEITLFKCWSHHCCLLFFCYQSACLVGVCFGVRCLFFHNGIILFESSFSSHCFFFFKSPVEFAKIEGENVWRDTILRNESKIFGEKNQSKFDSWERSGIFLGKKRV